MFRVEAALVSYHLSSRAEIGDKRRQGTSDDPMRPVLLGRVRLQNLVDHEVTRQEAGFTVENLVERFLQSKRFGAVDGGQAFRYQAALVDDDLKEGE